MDSRGKCDSVAKESKWPEQATELVVAEMGSETSFPGFYKSSGDRVTSERALCQMQPNGETSAGPCEPGTSFYWLVGVYILVDASTPGSQKSLALGRKGREI